MKPEDQRAETRRQRDAAADRRDGLLGRARGLLNRARLADAERWDKSNVALAMRPETARFLLDSRPELFKHPKDSPEETFWLDGVRVFLSEQLDLDQVVLCHGWWPIVDETAEPEMTNSA